MIANQNIIYLSDTFYSIKIANNNTLENVYHSISIYTSNLVDDESTITLRLNTFSVINGEASAYLIINPFRYYKTYCYQRPEYMYLKRSAIIKKTILNFFRFISNKR